MANCETTHRRPSIHNPTRRGRSCVPLADSPRRPGDQPASGLAAGRATVVVVGYDDALHLAQTVQEFERRGRAAGMNGRLLAIMGLFSVLFGSCSKQPLQPAVNDPPESKFRAGQVWKFKTPPNQSDARLTVLRVERCGKLGTVVHIALTGVSYGNGQTTIQHLPFAESAVEQSVTALERESDEVPDFAAGYRQWRDAFDAGKGGVFSITVAEAFDAITGIARSRE